MAAKGYTDTDRIARHLGVTFTAEQNLLAEQLVAPAEAWIDQRTRRGWLMSAITDEAHYILAGPHLYLRKPPIASIQSVKARTNMFDTPDQTLVAGTTYEVRDLTTGWLYLPQMDPTALGVLSPLPYRYDRVLVSYTPSAGLPDDIRLAATLLVAHWLQPALSGLLPGIKAYSVGAELTVEYQDVIGELGMPAEVERLVNQRRRWSFA